MLKERQLPNHLWREETSTAFYIMNRCPIKNMSNKKPYEAWTCLKPGVGNFVIFGSIYYMHVLEKLIRKLDNRCQFMILIVYHSIGVYKIVSPNENKVIISRHVQFDERKKWNWLKVSNNLMQNDKGSNYISIDLQDGQVNGMEQTQKVRRSRKAITQPPRLVDYERFPNQAISANGDPIKEATIAGCEPTDLNQALKDEN